MRSLPRLHMLGIPHTITSDEYSHCAFTGKVHRFARMMQPLGYAVTHYGVEGAESGAHEQVDVLSRKRWDMLRAECGLKADSPRDFIGDLANIGNPLYQAFNLHLVDALAKRLRDTHDIICMPFGLAHSSAVAHFPGYTKVETGIGYPQTCERFRVFESYAWMHWHLGKEGKDVGDDYNWVVPNYFDVDEWPAGPGGKHLLYFGRITAQKGLDIIKEIGRARPDLEILLCGQGDPTPWLGPNIRAIPPVHGRERAKVLGSALAVLMPTRYIEPFGGVTVEANLCGTPVLGSAFGSFTETITDGDNGFRCHTMGDYLAAIERVERDGGMRHGSRSHACARYGMSRVADYYDRVFQQLDDLHGDGYNTRSSLLGPIGRACPYDPPMVSPVTPVGSGPTGASSVPWSPRVRRMIDRAKERFGR